MSLEWRRLGRLATYQKHDILSYGHLLQLSESTGSGHAHVNIYTYDCVHDTVCAELQVPTYSTESINLHMQL